MSIGKSYYRVTKPFTVWRAIGSCPSNAYYGSSRIFGTVYDQFTLSEGDELHDLPGGLFAVIDGEPYEVKLSVSEKGAFEKTYLPTPKQTPPGDRVEHIHSEDATRPKNGYNTEGKVFDAGVGQPIGRSINRLVT